MRSKIPYFCLAVLTVFALVFAVISVAQSRSSGATDTVLSFCGKPQAKPTTLVISCADANTEFTALRWYAWGDATTYASGEYRWNDCTPTCVAGTWKSKSVTIWAWDLRTLDGRTVYSKLSSDSGLNMTLYGIQGGNYVAGS